MNEFFSDTEVSTLFEYGFSSENRGYTPHVLEAPNGDGIVDTRKRYAHISPKKGLGPCGEIYDKCMGLARLAAALVVPSLQRGQQLLSVDSTIRVLEYQPGAESHMHTDFDLFTLSLYDTNPSQFYIGEKPQYHPSRSRMFHNLHIGELAHALDPLALPADPHCVHSGPELRRSIVFFVMPQAHLITLDRQSVRQWVEERKARSRVEVGAR